MSGLLHIDREFLDHLLELDSVLAAVIVAGLTRRQPLVRPSPGRGVGDGSNFSGNLGGLSGDGRWTEHNRQTTIDRVIHPIVERQAGEQTGGDSKSGSERPARGQGTGQAQLVPNGGQNTRTKLGRCAPRRYLAEPAFDILVHCHSFTI
jgi:hypothetical protein